jgi:hypothetical protein
MANGIARIRKVCCTTAFTTFPNSAAISYRFDRSFVIGLPRWSRKGNLPSSAASQLQHTARNRSSKVLPLHGPSLTLCQTHPAGVAATTCCNTGTVATARVATWCLLYVLRVATCCEARWEGNYK